MTIIHNNPGCKDSDTKRWALMFALQDTGIANTPTQAVDVMKDRTQVKKALLRHDVARAFSDFMSTRVTGRSYPVSSIKGAQPRHGSQYFFRPVSPFHGSYPRKIISNVDKMKFLNNKRDSDQISPEVYADLMSVLDQPERPAPEFDFTMIQ